MELELRRLAQNLKRLREERSLSQEGVAYRSGVTVKTVGSLERGDANPTLGVLVKLARGLEVDIIDLLA